MRWERFWVLQGNLCQIKYKKSYEVGRNVEYVYQLKINKMKRFIRNW